MTSRVFSAARWWLLILATMVALIGAMKVGAGRDHPRTVVHGLVVKYAGLGPERWAFRYRREHVRWKLEAAHRRRLALLLARARTVQAHEATDWRARQIAAAEQIGAQGDTAGTDPWPSCPDPYDHAGYSWDDTVQCENGGDWLDSPGPFRCGLQFEPRWETVYGRLCP